MNNNIVDHNITCYGTQRNMELLTCKVADEVDWFMVGVREKRGELRRVIDRCQIWVYVVHSFLTFSESVIFLRP